MKQFSRIFQTLRRFALPILSLLFIIAAAIICNSYYQSRFGMSNRGHKTLSKTIVAHHFRDNTYRLYNKDTEKYTTPKLNWISCVQEGDSLAVYALPYKRGYVNVNTGLITIDAQTNHYSKAWGFSEGLAAVKKGDKIGFINKDNEVVIPFKIDYSERYLNWEFSYIFMDGHCIVSNKDGDLGVIDTQGSWVIEPEYDEICPLEHNMYHIVMDNGKYGVIDSNGVKIFPVEYDDICITENNREITLTKDGRMWQEDFNGNILNPFMFNDITPLQYPIGYDSCDKIMYGMADYGCYRIDYSYGIVNRVTGQMITPAIYANIKMISPKLFKVQDQNSFEWLLLDTNGKKVFTTFAAAKK